MTSSGDNTTALMGDTEDWPPPGIDSIEPDAPPGPDAPLPPSLPRMRARLLEALNREDFRTIQRELPHYQELLEAAARSGVMSPERLARLELEHQNFHEQLRATLLTTRIALRLEIERVRASRQYAEDDSDSDAVCLHG